MTGPVFEGPGSSTTFSGPDPLPSLLKLPIPWHAVEKSPKHAKSSKNIRLR